MQPAQQLQYLVPTCGFYFHQNKKQNVCIQNLPLQCLHGPTAEDEHKKLKRSLLFNLKCGDQGCHGYDISAGPFGPAARQHRAHLACESEGCRSS